MKKTTTKLQLKKNTIRLLQDSQLGDVHGGAPTNNQQVCSNTCMDCPPPSCQCGPSRGRHCD
jgi:hypothetical protein